MAKFVAVSRQEEHRLVGAEKISFYKFPVSVFEYIKKRYLGETIENNEAVDAVDAIHRCFSLARLYGAKMYVEELIPAKGQLYDDTHDFIYRGRKDKTVEQINAEYVAKVAAQEADRIYANCDGTGLVFKAQRISFWKKDVTQKSLEKRLDALDRLKNSDCIGYMILHKAGCFKNDEEEHVRWVVYEAVINGGRFQRGIIPHTARFSFRVGTGKSQAEVRSIHGHLYCQQNGRTVVCAHVAIRTLLSALLPERDISYRKISELAGFEGGAMDTKQIVKVFKSFGFSVHVWSNQRRSGRNRIGIPIYHCLYSGIESGGGGLLGFDVKKPETENGTTCDGAKPLKGNPYRHIIPLFGHTFNKHIWVNEASGYYSLDGAGEPKSFISDNWVSTFLGHDDNIGPNIYIPRFYVERLAVSSVFSVVPCQSKGDEHSIEYLPGVKAEQITVDWLLNGILDKLNEWETEGLVHNDWLERLHVALDTEKGKMDPKRQIARVVLRSVLLSRRQYRSRLLSDCDMAGQHESKAIIDGVLCKQNVPDRIWMVEFSLPHLFPVNERKLGEIVLAAHEGVCSKTYGVLFARLPSRYLLPNLSDGASLTALSCQECASQIMSHVPCFHFAGAKRVG